MKSLEGKVALVTGASAGLGAATALQLASEGAKVMIAARRRDQSEVVLRQIEALGAEAAFVQTDVARREDIEAMVAATVARFGRLDCAVNNAGISGQVRTPIADIDEERWDEVIRVNLKAVFLCMKFQIPVMLAQGAGAIVNVASIYGLKPSDLGHAAYATSKHGVVGLTKSAAIDYGQSGLRINAVAPGYTRSEMVNPDKRGAAEAYRVIANKHSAMNRLGEADEIARAISWLCSDAATFVNGAVLAVDGGETTRLY